MYFRLSDHIALRSWKFVPRAYYEKNRPYAGGLTKEEFDLMLLCDGAHDLEKNGLTERLEMRGLIQRCEAGTRNAEWSERKTCPHRYFPKMNLMITGKCNYNCLHCFNAADNAPLMSEWRYEELLELLDQARDCGINAFTITGGEPMLHPHFMDIVKAIYDRGMYVEELNTNGFFIRQEILDEMKELGCMPLMKISFDGMGCHDWMRDHKGAGERTLAAMALCAENGFRVMSQTQVHRKNLHTLRDTAHKLEETGVRSLRLIRTTEVKRWAENAPDSCLGIEEYYENMLDFAGWYRNSGIGMDVVVWQFMRLYPDRRAYSLEAVMCCDGHYNPATPVCKDNRSMVAVTSSGDVVPCLQMSGTLEEQDVHLGNLHETPLQELLADGDYMQTVCMNLHHLLKDNPKCAACRYFPYCNGGCRALGFLFTGSMSGADPAKCLFFENGWYQKAVETMGDWHHLTRMNTDGR